MQLVKNLRQFLGFLILTLSLGGLLGATGVQAAQCKGMSKSKCEGATECSWVKGYTLSSGKTVSAYCRSTPSKSGGKKAESSKSTNDKKKSADKTADKTKEQKTKKDEAVKKEKKEKKKSSSTDSKSDKK